MKTDTIAAVATALGNSGIGIIRISGDDAFSIINEVFNPKKRSKKLSECQSHTIHYGHICEKNAQGESHVIDEVMVSIMKAPNTYTREDTVEINCHGGIVVTKKILETVIKHGAGLAEPGEFTKRAFLNGRIDLSQAESIMDLIAAKNEFALENSIRQLQGSVRNKVKNLRAAILYEIAFIESALDDPEHSTIEGYGDELLIKIEKAKKEIEFLLLTSENGELLKEGIKTVIVGKPNVGKSSLMNLLIGHERAIVTDVPGTTRDVIKEQINLHGISLNMIDTAGIRDTDDRVEKIGLRKSREYIMEADLILYLIDLSEELDENDDKIMEMISDKKVIILLNKSDLPSVINREELEEKIKKQELGTFLNVIIPFSVKEESGVDALGQAIKDMFFQGKISSEDELMITNVRHKSALKEAKKSLEMVEQSIRSGMPEDFYSIDLMDAYEELGKILGESLGEDLVNEIFSKFCMGK